jgi:DNA-binding transcriptional LysR family regulator
MVLHHLCYFLAVADALNFSRAAGRFRAAQPALRQRLCLVNMESGTVLPDR